MRGYKPAIQETLEIAWKRGYLSNTQHYELLSKLTGLSRSQISNWATRKIRKLGIGSAPLPSVNRDPVANTGDIAESQRFLEIAWERGLLPGLENYTLIQDFTNLSRKQISNWSRRRVRKLEKGKLNGNIVSQSSQMVVTTAQPRRKRSLKVRKERVVKRRVDLPRQPALSVLVKLLLMNAVSSVANIDEKKIGLLSTLIGHPKEEVRKFLLANGRCVEEEGDLSTKQLPVMEKTHLVPEQQRNTPLQPKAEPELDTPMIKTEKIEYMKEKSLEDWVGNLAEQHPVMEKMYAVPVQQNTSLQLEAQPDKQNTSLQAEAEPERQNTCLPPEAQHELDKPLTKIGEIESMKENGQSKTQAADPTV